MIECLRVRKGSLLPLLSGHSTSESKMPVLTLRHSTWWDNSILNGNEK